MSTVLTFKVQIEMRDDSSPMPVDAAWVADTLEEEFDAEHVRRVTVAPQATNKITHPGVVVREIEGR